MYLGSDIAIVKKLNRLYADDLLCRAETQDETLNTYPKTKAILLQGGFNLRKWNSKDKQALSGIKELEGKKQALSTQPPIKPQIAAENQTYSQYHNGSLTGDGSTKVLGVNWNSHTDSLLLDLNTVVELKVAAKIYDPLGLLSLFTIGLKVLFQRLSADKVPWDENLQGENKMGYNKLIKDIINLQGVSVPRCLFQKGKVISRIKIHGFLVASKKAYAAIVYLHTEY